MLYLYIKWFLNLRELSFLLWNIFNFFKFFLIIIIIFSDNAGTH